jgi:hypothetical protein
VVLNPDDGLSKPKSEEVKFAVRVLAMSERMDIAGGWHA